MKSKSKSILETAPLAMGIRLEEILSPSREARTVVARSIIAWHMRTHGFSTTQTGYLLNRDHATIVHLGKIYNENSRKGARYYNAVMSAGGPGITGTKMKILRNIAVYEGKIASLKEQLHEI